MGKAKTIFVCNECGYETPRWLGKCPDCGNWNTLTEQEKRVESERKLHHAPGGASEALRISEIPDQAPLRVTSGIAELDRVLGGGVVEGSLVLLGGDPGIGKSTLLTQLCANLSHGGSRVLYVSAEESARQLKLRATRLGAADTDFFVLAENDLQAIEARITELSPTVVVVDSIQTVYLPTLASAPGSVSQVRECAARLMRYAKSTACTVFLVGHVTKDGAIAGPRVLEHMVDAVLYFEGDRNHHYRLLRAVKNRFGSVNELGIFQMTSEGMQPVPNPSEALLSQRAHNASGSAILCTMEGTRPLLTDVQALVAPTVFGNPRRMSSGVDQARLALLLAVLEKRAGLRLYDKDVYINIAGGITLTEPAADLALCIAVASSYANRATAESCAVMGEVGLAGELRAVPQADRRIAEAIRLGFTQCIVPKGNQSAIDASQPISIIAASSLPEALAALSLLPHH